MAQQGVAWRGVAQRGVAATVALPNFSEIVFST
jgi:hypothetical protein